MGGAPFKRWGGDLGTDGSGRQPYLTQTGQRSGELRKSGWPSFLSLRRQWISSPLRTPWNRLLRGKAACRCLCTQSPVCCVWWLVFFCTVWFSCIVTDNCIIYYTECFWLCKGKNVTLRFGLFIFACSQWLDGFVVYLACVRSEEKSDFLFESSRKNMISSMIIAREMW